MGLSMSNVHSWVRAAARLSDADAKAKARAKGAGAGAGESAAIANGDWKKEERRPGQVPQYRYSAYVHNL